MLLDIWKLGVFRMGGCAAAHGIKKMPSSFCSALGEMQELPPSNKDGISRQPIQERVGGIVVNTAAFKGKDFRRWSGIDVKKIGVCIHTWYLLCLE